METEAIEQSILVIMKYLNEKTDFPEFEDYAKNEIANDVMNAAYGEKLVTMSILIKYVASMLTPLNGEPFDMDETLQLATGIKLALDNLNGNLDSEETKDYEDRLKLIDKDFKNWND